LKSLYSDDGVHPNKFGYQVMSPLTEAAILKNLNLIVDNLCCFK